MNDIEHPDITRANRTGYAGKERSFKCLICGMECDTIYLDLDGDAVGCDECITVRSADSYFNED